VASDIPAPLVSSPTTGFWISQISGAFRQIATPLPSSSLLTEQKDEDLLS
jgi:hypothetical protein